MREQLSNNFESRKLELVEKLDLRNQWEKQARALRDTGILEILGESNEMGIIGINGKEYPLPSYEDILDRITPEKLELLERKARDGFTELLLVPLGISFEILIDRYIKLLLKKYEEGTLYDTSGDKLELDTKDPIFMIEEYKKELVYYPKEFSDNHQGKTKKEILEKEDAWEILLIENHPNLPGEDNEEVPGIKKGREPLGAFKTAEEYLKILREDPNYQDEQGPTPESWLTYAITYLYNNDQQIDDYHSNGKACLLIGSYIPGNDRVLNAFWRSRHNQARLDKFYLDTKNQNCSTRPSVKI